MTDRILVVTSPDDSLLQGIRIAHVHLNEDQSNIISNALLQASLPHDTIINYVWKMGDPVSWLIDKILKSDVIIFNADATPNGAVELILGWVAAQPRSYYFGNLRDLHVVNDRVIYSSADVLNLIEKISTKYDI